jgi:hypothetical protein
MAPRVAVLYSGRFFGKLAASWIANHMRHLIMPLNASIFVVAEPSSYCYLSKASRAAYNSRAALNRARRNASTGNISKASAAADLHFLAAQLFEVDVRDAFQPWNDVHAFLLPSENVAHGYFPHELGFSYRNAARRAYQQTSPFFFKMIERWYRQFHHVAAADTLRRNHGPHDVVIRARIDAVFPHAIRLPATIGPKHVFAVKQYKYYNPNDPKESGAGVVWTRTNDSEGQEPSCAALPTSNISNTSSHTHPDEHTPCAPFWTDWFYAGTMEAMSAAFQSMIDPRQLKLYSDVNARCGGLCPEEQTVLQLQAQSITVRALPWKLCIVRNLNGSQSPDPLVGGATTCSSSTHARGHSVAKVKPGCEF